MLPRDRPPLGLRSARAIRPARALFPEVVPPGTQLGKLRDGLAARTGLKRIEVVAPATHDTGAAVAAVPTQSTGKPNWAYISSGTWSLLGVEVQQAVLSERALELNVTNEGGIDRTYRLLKNIMGLWLVQECKRSFERRGKSYDYAELTRLAGQARPLRSLVNPDDLAFLKPDDMVTALQKWCGDFGEPVPQDEGALIRCALESLAFRYRMVLEWLEELTGTRIEVLHIVGGGCQNEALNQLTADACGRPVITGPVEATVLGNVLIQARTQGELKSLADLRRSFVNRAPSRLTSRARRQPGTTLIPASSTSSLDPLETPLFEPATDNLNRPPASTLRNPARCSMRPPFMSSSSSSSRR